MNEIEKLYENAGVERVQHCVLCDNPCPDDCYTGYLFTAEKQLELIKWMIKTNHRYFIQDIIVDDFSKTLAGVFNLYWQDLTKEEKQQIKEILE